MARVTFTRAALDDLEQIDAYLVAEGGLQIAEAWLEKLNTTAQSLAAMPLRGQLDPRLRPGRRRLVQGSYLIVYEIDATDQVIVLRIVHGARDLPSLFADLADD